jgi:hypothetical protein
VSQSATSTVLRHLDGCMNSKDPIPCFLNGRTCQAEHVIGEIEHVNNDTARVVLTRIADSIGGVSSYVTVWFTEFGQQLNLCLSLDQDSKITALLHGALSVHELYRADDAVLHAQVTK